MYYYATYNAARSILAAQEDFHGETHTSAIHAYNGLAAKLPHPFNMIATHVKGEEYQAILPSYPDAVKVDLTQKFSNDRVVAQGMLRAYLSGTADWNVGKIKERLKREGKVQDFRTKASQALRDSKLPLKFNYLNCIFRYRGKANYRDTIFLPYGKKHSWLNPGYLHGLYVMSSFAFICGVAFAEKRIGKKRVVAFIEDIAGNLRGRDSAMGLELFWEDLVSNYIRSS
ncbi:MAG: hypothetical protein BWY76_02431 [bacterium ADurb.Bin429]|nr:MAG: hypothetical protein BWY76_02431 [bacterium ADurb.Bin429]